MIPLVAASAAACVVVVLLRPGVQLRSPVSIHPPRSNQARHRIPAPSRWVQAAVVGVAGVLVVIVLGPLTGIAALVSAGAARAAVVRTNRRRRRGEVDRSMPDLLDLLRIAAAAGHPVHRCIAEVSVRAPGPVQPPLRRVVERVQRGAPLAPELADAAEALGSLGPALTDALIAASVTGAPLGPALDRVAATARDRRRRTAEVAARRLPVTLLFPLVCCVLPAFVLLAVVPLLAGSLAALGR